MLGPDRLQQRVHQVHESVVVVVGIDEDCRESYFGEQLQNAEIRGVGRMRGVGGVGEVGELSRGLGQNVGDGAAVPGQLRRKETRDFETGEVGGQAEALVRGLQRDEVGRETGGRIQVVFGGEDVIHLVEASQEVFLEMIIDGL